MKNKNKVINCIAYQQGKRLNNITINEISEVIKEPDTFIWLGLWQPEDAFMRKIQQEFNLHDLAIEDALCAHQRPKIETYGDSLFIVVKTVQWEKEEVAYGETHFFVGKNFLITLRHGASASYAAVRLKAEENPNQLCHGPGFALYSILDFIVDNYRHIVGQFETIIENIESSMFKSEFDEKAIENVYSLRRHLLALRNAALPMDEICNQLIHLHEDIIHKELRAYIRDVQDHTRHVTSKLDDMREMLTNAMHVNLALVSVKQNEVVKGLAGWGAILAIPTVVFSLYGMNFENMTELKLPWAYHTLLSITAVSCFFLYKKLKRSGWI